MKRTATAALAAATAMSLAVAPAFAEESAPNGENDTTPNATDEENGGSSSQGESKEGEKTGSSDISDEAAKDYFDANKDKATGIVKSSTEGKEGEDPKELSDAFLSSIKSDKANEWEPGKTANILLGTGIGAVVLGLLAAVAAGGVIPGLNLPF
ncbi:hypothetical protein FPH17_10425 [Corynebacterium godavarianum]|uniref:Secreted protein n=1 Tax=Corynebacterium godavarianum TaxID=2054421 RepID=A0ABY3DYK3_9CORY|nr:hypothetical protein [Corynebacterium godavarianum]MBL7284755.1 hypothetical protein [Corynebacterium godavarianum]TSJ71191.1 hypothetical protein FPH17_10425 [Corynebacterium godavarianum]